MHVYYTTYDKKDYLAYSFIGRKRQDETLGRAIWERGGGGRGEGDEEDGDEKEEEGEEEEKKKKEEEKTKKEEEKTKKEEEKTKKKEKDKTEEDQSPLLFPFLHSLVFEFSSEMS
ncbi:hypothetical protein HOO65_060048 [Ceratocystis lukuohia]|uniref:Uncharacterized protein n=1 Tax=Ceratocystis lukuohia TaxID=2019550 RepID=A0ABR4MD63_9PEZI